MNALLLCKICLLVVGLGVHGSEPPPEDRIINGAKIDISKVPCMLSYRVNGKHACGAAIVNEQWGLTAAHCVYEFIDNRSVSISVRSGSIWHDFGGVVHRVTSLVPHEKYEDDSNDYDIAVFKVNEPFRFNNVTQPLKLPEDPRNVTTDWGLVAGWGYFIDDDPVLSEYLQYVILPKVSREECVKDYEDQFEIPEHQSCYGFREGGKDSCKGDSGGPLINLQHFGIGITSWGADCGEPGLPGVYTNLLDFLDWVKNKTAINE